MPDIASVFKSEIARIARKELRAETERLRAASAQYRTEIAALKRRLASLEKQLSNGARKKAVEAPASDGDEAVAIRFSAKRLRANRERLGLSAADFGALAGVSGQTIYNWESETTRPRGNQLPAIAALRGIGKREAAARLEALAVSPAAAG